MANLRANKIYGTSGPDANGSAVFNGTDYLTAANAAAFRLNQGSGADFTIEAWVYAKSVGTQFTIASLYHTTGNKRSYNLYVNTDGELKFNYSGNGTAGNTSVLNAGLFPTNEWIHVALTHDTSATTARLFKNGVLRDDDTGAHATWYANTDGDFVVGSSLDGFISNLHINKGTCKYTAAFDPYKQPIEVETNTSVLCCNSSTDALNDDKSNTFVQTASGGVKAVSDMPFNRSDAGVVFDGDIKMNSQGVMYFPTGDTSQRGRGRAVFFGGYQGSSPAAGVTNIDYLNIQSGGISKSFGTLLENRRFDAGLASATRGVTGGSDGQPSWATGKMEYVTIATTSNSTTFGDMTQAGGMVSACSNNTRGLFFSVWDANTSGSSHKKHIDYITIASVGNSADFGELSVARPEAAGFGSPTRGICAGGYDALSPHNTQDTIDYVTIATTGNATDFGNLTVARQASGSASSSTRGVIAGGYASPAWQNTIDYVTIATTGNATDFGDLVTALYGQFVGNGSDKIRGVFAGGKISAPTYTNSIDYVTIATTGNTQDFGDIVRGTSGYGSVYGSICSDSHGGLS